MDRLLGHRHHVGDLDPAELVGRGTCLKLPVENGEFMGRSSSSFATCKRRVVNAGFLRRVSGRRVGNECKRLGAGGVLFHSG